MHRRPLLDLLASYERRYPAERDVVGRICCLVESRPDCFQRTCRPGHVTGSAWILSPDRRRCLLTFHRQLDRWLQLGGHADGQSRVEQVALREAREESGLDQFELVNLNGELAPLDVDVHQIPERRDKTGAVVEDSHEHHDIRFLLVADQEQGIQASDESHELRWFPLEEVKKVTDEESVLRMLRKARMFMDGVAARS